MTIRKLPREVSIRFVPVYGDPCKTHNVLEVCGKNSARGVRFVMAQDDEIRKERDKYKLRAHLQAERIAELEAENKVLEIKTTDYKQSMEYWEQEYRKVKDENKALREFLKKLHYSSAWYTTEIELWYGEDGTELEQELLKLLEGDT